MYIDHLKNLFPAIQILKTNIFLGLRKVYIPEIDFTLYVPRKSFTEVKYVKENGSDSYWFGSNNMLDEDGNTLIFDSWIDEDVKYIELTFYNRNPRLLSSLFYLKHIFQDNSSKHIKLAIASCDAIFISIDLDKSVYGIGAECISYSSTNKKSRLPNILRFKIDDNDITKDLKILEEDLM